MGCHDRLGQHSWGEDLLENVFQEARFHGGMLQVQLWPVIQKSLPCKEGTARRGTLKHQSVGEGEQEFHTQGQRGAHAHGVGRLWSNGGLMGICARSLPTT